MLWFTLIVWIQNISGVRLYAREKAEQVKVQYASSSPKTDYMKSTTTMKDSFITSFEVC